MISAKIDEHLAKFISHCINSVEQLEILLLLRSKRELDSETIVQELRTSSTSVEKRLSDLMRKNLVGIREVDDARLFFYDPSQQAAEIIDQLATLYASHRVAVIHAIFSKQPEALKDFSEAFRFKE